MLRNIKILTALLFLINTANAQTVSPPTCSINGATITCPNGSLIPGGVPGGSNTQVQFNDSGVFGGSSLFTFNKTTGQISNNQGILTTSSPFTVTQTWNSGGTTFTGILGNITDTASASNSLLMDLQVGGSSVFNITKAGSLISSGSSTITGTGAFAWGARSKFRSPADGQVTLLNAAEAGFTRLNFGGTTSSFPALKVSGTQLQVRLGDDTGYSVIAPSALILQGQTTLGSDAADILAQRNGTNAQAFRVYNTYTDASNYERGVFDWSTTSNTLTIGTQAAGTGTARNVNFMRNGVTTLQLATSGIFFAANFLAGADNTYDIGASGANRPRTGYFGTSLNVAAQSTLGSNALQIASTTAIPAGGNNATGLKATSTANFGVFFGSGAPTLSAAKGSLYLRSDGTGSNDRAYINTDGGTTWTNVVTGG